MAKGSPMSFSLSSHNLTQFSRFKIHDVSCSSATALRDRNAPLASSIVGSTMAVMSVDAPSEAPVKGGMWYGRPS